LWAQLTLKCVPEKIAAEITKRIKVPVISIGSGSGCDGQFLFAEDMLGIEMNPPRHAKKYRSFYDETLLVFKEFKKDSEEAVFPTENKIIKISDQEFEQFMDGVDSLS